MINRALPVVLSGALLASCGDRQLIAEAEEAVANQLIDPNSAEFRNVQVTDDDNVCGEVNAKNRMGGYTGFTPFAAVKDPEGKMFAALYDESEMSDLPPQVRNALKKTIDPIYRVCFPDDARFAPVLGVSQPLPTRAPVEELTGQGDIVSKAEVQAECDSGEAWACEIVADMADGETFQY